MYNLRIHLKRSLGKCNIYRPQTKFAKVMFLHLSVSHSVRGGVPAQVPPRDQVHPLTRYTPWDQVHPSSPWDQVKPLGTGTPLQDQVHPPGPGTHLGSGTPQDQVSPRTRYTPSPLGPGTSTRDQVHPPPPPRAVHAGRYGQQVGGTHPTGMHSCFTGIWLSTGVFVADTPPSRHPPPPWADTPPPRATLPWTDTPWAENPLGRHPPTQRRPLKQAVHSLLECILVSKILTCPSGQVN